MDRSKRNEAGWLLNERGNIIVYPVVEQYIGGMHGMGCALRFEISTRSETPHSADTTVQLLLSPEQLASLATALQKSLAEQSAPATRPN